MTRARSVSPLPEPVNWRRVCTLLEAQDKKISLIAEGVGDIQPRIVRIEKRVEGLEMDLAEMKPVIRTLANDVAELKKDMKEVKNPLAVAETKFPS